MAQSLVQRQEQKLLQQQRLTQQQMMVVRMLEMPLAEFEQATATAYATADDGGAYAGDAFG